ncbi:nuclear transport factor 2 family protein [Streptomyces ossamyceticus]|nr:nuclear transport factor 2 family protein [Streptomyces ossamyceticus]
MTTDDMQDYATSCSALVTAGIDHVRLVYAYLAEGDLDGYLSLLDSDMTVHPPGRPSVRGREAVAALRRTQLRGHSMQCTVSDVYADGRTVVVVGRYSGDALHGYHVDVDFCDIYAIAPSGLLLSQKTFFSVPPPA